MIYVCAPVESVTGGVELLHQLVYRINENIGNASIVYLPTSFRNYFSYHNYLIPEIYKKYVKQTSIKIRDKRENCVVVPETLAWKLNEIKKAKKYLWWLSVDHYMLTNKKRFIKFKMRGKELNLMSNKLTHLVQSFYAYEWLLKQGVDKRNIFFLSDYLRSDYIDRSQCESEKIKIPQVLYNPQKGLDFTKKIISRSSYEFIPLINYSPEEMADIMQQSKVYIDFGNHPGKDRIPREAAISGCCIITGRKGAAANNVDVAIPSKYKFSDRDDSIDDIVNCIDFCMRNYYTARKDFDLYRKKIIEEKNLFDQQIKNIFG